MPPIQISAEPPNPLLDASHVGGAEGHIHVPAAKAVTPLSPFGREPHAGLYRDFVAFFMKCDRGLRSPKTQTCNVASLGASAVEV